MPSTYNQFKMKLACLIVCALPLLGQSLQITGDEGAPGEQVSVKIVLSSPAGKEPAALQWETSFPAKQLTLAGAAPLIGFAAHGAGKTINCSGTVDTKKGRIVHRCLLVGGNKLIANGPVAVLTLKISPAARPGKIPIRIEHAMAVSGSAEKTDLKDSEDAITVRR